MDDLKKAYETLGLTDKATIDEIEHKYFLLIRREKARLNKSSSKIQVSSTSNRESKENMNAIIDSAEEKFALVNAAYQLIIAHERTQKMEQNYPELKTKSQARIKLEHFWEYYRFHTIAGIIGFIILILIAQTVIENKRQKDYEASLPPINLSISLFGAYQTKNLDADLSPLEKNIMQMMTQWQRIQINLVYSPIEAKDQFDMAYQQKSVIALVTENPDIYITDAENFQRLATQNLFKPVNDFYSKLFDVLGDTTLHYAQPEEQPEKIAYGIDISNSPIFKNQFINNQAKIICIRIDAQNLDHAIALIRELLKELNQFKSSTG
jgi:hypothetical protein